MKVAENEALIVKEPGKLCNSRKRSAPGYCEQVSGWGTGHLGQGRCKLHGGSTPIKYGAYSKIVPRRHLSLLEDIKMDELSDLTHEIVKLKSYLIDMTAAEDVYEPLVDVEGNGRIEGVKFSSLTEAEMLDYSIKIIGMLDKLVSSINVEKDRTAKRGDRQQEFLKFISPLVDKFFEAVEASVKDVRVERRDIPRAVSEKLYAIEIWQ